MSAFQQLGLPDTATPDEIKAKWRQLASETHPDKGGDPAEFARLRKAYNLAMEEASAPKPCVRCGGRGKVQHVNGWTKVDMPCTDCGGSGEQS